MKLYLRTLGCDKNSCDSEALIGLLTDNGHSFTENPEDADIMIVNTCGFINDAKIQSIESLVELGEIKKDSQKLICCGCLSQRYGEELKKAMPEVDSFFGVNDYESFPEVLGNGNNVLLTSKAPKTYCEFGRRVQASASWTAPLKISEGCRNVCSYCAIPFIRGGIRSRQEKVILDEARQLAKEGVKELVLVAQDLTAYGMDLRDGSNLPDLLKKLCRIDGIQWIRLMYCYEDEITDELIETIKTEEKICHYIDIPLQHYSDKILKAMNRRSSEKSIKATIKKLCKQIPDIVIRTTFIVGFPGETKEDFKKLYDFAAETGFGRLGAFAYSREEGTKAYSMKQQVKKDAKERRLDKLMRLQQAVSLANNEKLIGTVQEILIEEDPGDGTYIGRTRYDAAEIDNGVLVKSKGKLLPGMIIKARVIDAFDYDLVAEEI